MLKPAILVVGGAWHTGDYLFPLAQAFRSAGYETHAVPLPSVGANPPSKDFHEDVATIRKTATQLIAEQKDIIAVLHSIGGIMGTEALAGLGKKSAGCGLLAITYIAAMVPDKGHSFEAHLEACGDQSWKPARETFTVDGMLSLPPDFAQGMFYNDLGEEEAKHWTALLKPQSVGVYFSPLTSDTYNEVPCGYILASQDKAFSYDYQLQTVAMRGFPTDKTLTLDTGHTPWMTKPEAVRDFVLRTAGEAQ